MRLHAWMAGVAVGCSGAPQPASLPGPPPVVVVSIDTLRADHLGFHGYTARPTSPHLDALAAESVVFEQHQSAAPWTTPAHLSMMTGLYPAHHGVMQPYFELVDGLESGGRVDALEDSVVTLAELLAGAGYRTAAFTGGGAVDPATGLGQGFARYETDHYKLTDRNLATLDAWMGESSTPFLLFWHTFEVHAPYTDGRFLEEGHAPEPAALASLHTELAKLDTLLRKGRPSETHQGKAHQMMARMLGEHGMRTPVVTEALYDGGIAAMDARIGELVALLKRRGLYDDCLLIITSDHGDEFEDHNPYYYDAHGHSLYEELVHTPLLVKLPGQAEGGRRLRQRVSAVDLLPTVASVLSLPPPAGLDGRSLLPMMTGQTDLPAVPVFSESLNDKREMKAVHDGERKLIVTIPPRHVAQHGRLSLPAAPRLELYRTSSDPAERRDLSAEEDTTVLLEAVLTHLSTGQRSGASASMDAETLRQLEAMGYLEQPSARPELQGAVSPAPQ